MFSELPEELMEKIFKHVTNFRWPAANLKSLCLTSRQFRRIAQPLLPIHIRIGQRCLLPLICEIYYDDTKRNAVKILELTTDFASSCVQNGAFMMLQFPGAPRRWVQNELNSMSPRWRAFSQSQQFPRNEHEHWFRIALIFMLPNLETLYIDTYSAPEHLFWSLLEHLGRDCFPSFTLQPTTQVLHKLTMVTFEARTTQTEAPGLDLIFRLPNIRYIRCLSINIRSADNNGWRFPSGDSTVEELEFRDCQFDPTAQRAIATACHIIRKLRLYNSIYFVDILQETVTQHNSSLEELIVDVDDLQDLDNPWAPFRELRQAGALRVLQLPSTVLFGGAYFQNMSKLSYQFFSQNLPSSLRFLKITRDLIDDHLPLLPDDENEYDHDHSLRPTLETYESVTELLVEFLK
jgi:hypothetical protein